MDIGGTFDPRFEAVRIAFEEGFASRGELGAAVSVVVDGRCVVDLWGGYVDKARERPWQRDTLVNVYSATKGLTAIVAHRLVDEGRLDLDARVGRIWPEFAAAGKDDVRVHQLLDHTAGLPALRAPLPPDTVYDWDAMTRALAAEPLWWAPGTKHGYHAMTYGWLVGEVVRRTAWRSVRQLLSDEVAGPLGADVQLGVAPPDEARVSNLRASPPPPAGVRNFAAELLAAPDSMAARAFTNPVVPLLPSVVNSRAWRSAELPAVNAHATARGLARIYGALAVGGTLDGVRLLSPEAIARARAEAAFGVDAVLGETTRFGLGFMLSHDASSFGAPEAFGHPGGGGSLGFADPEARVGFGYVMNKMGPHILVDPRARVLADAVYASLGG